MTHATSTVSSLITITPHIAESVTFEWIVNYTARVDKIVGRGNGQIMQFICN